MQSVQSESQQHELTSRAAFFLWEQRGCPFGTPEVHWVPGRGTNAPADRTAFREAFADICGGNCRFSVGKSCWARCIARQLTCSAVRCESLTDQLVLRYPPNR